MKLIIPLRARIIIVFTLAFLTFVSAYIFFSVKIQTADSSEQIAQLQIRAADKQYLINYRDAAMRSLQKSGLIVTTLSENTSQADFRNQISNIFSAANFTVTLIEFSKVRREHQALLVSAKISVSGTSADILTALRSIENLDHFMKIRSLKINSEISDFSNSDSITDVSASFTVEAYYMIVPEGSAR